MAAAKYLILLFFVLVLCAIHPAHGRGGRGGGSRGGGSRGGSSSGSRGSSSGSRGSSSSGTNLDRSSSGRSNPSPPSPKVDWPQPVRPSVPEPPRVVVPSAPRLPETPVRSQPSNPYPVNPDFAQPPKPKPGPNIPDVNPPSYGRPAPGNLPPYSPRENPPPYSPGNPPPYSPGNPPYLQPGGQRPGPNIPQPNAPPYGSGHPGNLPPYPPPPYGGNTGTFPQGSPHGQPPYGGVNRPNYPQGNPPPYGVNPAVLPGHGMQPGNPPRGGQPSNFPYPRQPGMSYPPGGSGLPNYYAPGGYGGYQGISSVEPHKKKGLLGGILSFGKKPKHHGVSSPFGAPSLGRHGISPAHMILPMTAMKKPHKSFGGFKPHHLILPYLAYRSIRWGGIGFDDDDYDRRCFRPRPPVHGSISCEHTLQKVECKARCQEGYRFQDNSTEIEAYCWRFSGYWSRSRFLPACKAYCKADECQNGGKCSAPGVCHCTSEYRGANCEHHVLNCDILKFARGSKISWVCSHSRNETVCKVRCRSPLVFETPTVEQYHCHLNGTWVPDRIPQCVEESRSTEGTQSTALPTEATQEG